ncbi:lipopolysaccharide assembly protein LapA domain-containing protein [Streptomyces sp. SAJ15]|uniref:lipopolysaccharide assembly protein LapA domain-containing protein n=1 Tax=Streptomyces sp. SAJ15 TaxID=2011095 RepID=UPI001186F602|nr:LapA family protein [Streptomyces sp. SAJ15]TVL92955.1 DUF1049 domain-containing protein [Streptomyces sp. SAJ15]
MSAARGKHSGFRGGMRDLVSTPGRVAGLILFVLALIFIFENMQQVGIRLLFWEVTMPLWLALLGMGVVGALCGALLFRRH